MTFADPRILSYDFFSLRCVIVFFFFFLVFLFLSSMSIIYAQTADKSVVGEQTNEKEMNERVIKA